MLQHLSTGTEIATATLLIDTENHPSLAVAQRAGFQRVELISSNAYYKRSVPERSCSDGVVAIRRREISDLEAHLDAIDDQQIQ